LNPAQLSRSECLRSLGLDDAAQAPAIRRAYRRLALRHHPDRNGGSDEAHRSFIQISEAYRGLMCQEAERAKAKRRPRTVTPAEMAVAIGLRPVEMPSTQSRASRRTGTQGHALASLVNLAIALTLFWAFLGQSVSGENSDAPTNPPGILLAPVVEPPNETPAMPPVRA
jgi:hypothetical protein